MRLMWWGVGAVLAIIVCFGLWLMFLGLRNVYRGYESAHWPVAKGVVAWSETTSKSSMTSADIRIRYSVNGRDYTTTTRHFGQTLGSGDVSEAQLLMLRYPKDAQVTVSYAPENPEIAAAESGFAAESLWLPGAGLAFAAVSVMFYAMFLGSEGAANGMTAAVSLFAVIFMLIGVPMLAFGSLNLYRAAVSEKWPTTKGEIVYGDLNESVSTEKDEDGHKETTVTYAASLVYRYNVNGRRYYSNVRRFGQLAGADAGWAMEILERYPKGTKLDVSYDPSDPNLAALETGIENEAYWLPGAGLAFFLFGVAVALIIVPQMKKFPQI